MPKNIILTKQVAERKMERIAFEIAEELYEDSAPLIIIGIAGSGMVIASKIFALLSKLIKTPIHLITCILDKKNPTTITYNAEINFDNNNVLLIDDVSNTGRTMLYALKPLLLQHPRRIQTVALLERMHKIFPIKTDFIGLSVATTLQNHIQVEVEEDEVIGAFML